MDYTAEAPLAQSGGPVEARPRLLPILAGLLIGFGLPFFPIYGVLYAAAGRLGWSWAVNFGAVNVIEKILLIAALLAVVVFWERLSLSTIGIRPLVKSDIAVGVTGYAILIALNAVVLAIHGWLAPPHHPLPAGVSPLAPKQFSMLKQIPLWLSILVVISNGFAEELSARGFAIERLQALTHSTFAAAASAWIMDLLVHLPFWGPAYVLEIGPAQLVFVLIYVWRRRLAPCIIAHILLDLGPFLIMRM